MLTRTKSQEELGTRRCMQKSPKEAFRIKGAWWNAEQNKNTNNNSHIEEGKKKKSPKNIKWTNQTGKEPYENHSEKNRALQNAQKEQLNH